MFLLGKTSLLKKISWASCFALFVISSCTIIKVKNYPPNKPFIFANKIIVKGNISKDEKKRLTNELDNYWDDSIKARRVQQFGLKYVIPDPAAYDSLNMMRSLSFMNAYLNSQGYYAASLKDSIHIDSVKKNQYRTTTVAIIDAGKRITIDSVGFALNDSTLQKLTLSKAKESKLKKGDVYTKQVISDELNRLTSVFHQNGYYKLTREDLYALVDTVDTKLLKLSLDPLEQAKIISDAAQKRKENPTWDIIIKQRSILDSSKIIPYYIGKTYFYPELNDYYNIDTVRQRNYKELATKKGHYIMRYHQGKFSLRPLREHSYLKQGDVYNEDLYNKSINAFNQIGAWKPIDAQLVPAEKDTVDLYYYMVPVTKQEFSVNLETSSNTGGISAGNFLGIATDFNYRNHNVWKQAIQAVTNFRFGVELNVFHQPDNSPINNNSLLQTFQISGSQTYAFPKLIIPFRRWRYLNTLDNKRTLVSASANYTDRKTFYQLRSITGSFGYEWSKGPYSWSFKPLNVELYALDTLPNLVQEFQNNPFLRNSFRNGNVVSTIVSVTRTFNNKNNPASSHLIRLGGEESGALLSNLIPSVEKQLFNYIKLEAEHRFLYKFKKSEFATRFFVGVGLPKKGEAIPVFKQFSLGGPNSMRAWRLRQLGLGSSILADTSTSGYTDRFGDFAMEGNLEYRFNLATIGGVKIASALFADMGNIWNLGNDTTDPKAIFKFSNLGKDVAIGMGTGIRLDFSYFLIRFDFGYRVKDPARQQNNGWMSFKDFEWTDTRQNGVKISNYAFQFGIGLPF